MSTQSSSLSDAQASTKAIFALDVTTAGIALIILGIGTLLLLKWSASSRHKPSKSNKADDDSHAPLKSPVAVYAFLLPALFFLTIAYAVQAAETPLKLNGTYPIDGDLGLGGRRNPGTADNYTISALSFTFRLCDIFFTILLNGAVWLHSAHVTSNGTGTAQPSLKSRLWNTFILSSMLGTGVASWAVAIAGRDEQDVVDPTFSQVVDRELAAQILYIIYRCVVIVASLSVSITVLRDYSDLSKNGVSGNKERPLLMRFALFVVPLIWLRDIFIIVDIVLIYVDAASWSSASRLAVTFLLIVFGQFANLIILATVQWGAWRESRLRR